MKLPVSWIALLIFYPAEAFQQPSRVGRGSIHRPRTQLSVASFDSIIEKFPFFQKAPINNVNDGSVATQFIENYNLQNIDKAVSLLDENCIFDDTAFSEPTVGLEASERRLRLLVSAKDLFYKVGPVASTKDSVGLRFQSQDGVKGMAIFSIQQNKITKIFWVQESSKAGEQNLKTLELASKIIKKLPKKEQSTTSKVNMGNTAPEKYFEAWNNRDMEAAIAVFSKDATYDDTAFPEPFQGKEKLQEHLMKVANCFPPTFSFEVDQIINAGSKIAVQWHVENDGEPLPFTRGSSFYSLDASGKIVDGIDFVEPSPPKKGRVDIALSQFQREPTRLIPAAAWILYMYIVFFSDGILPGANALSLEQRTWEEVRDLSLNFFLVSPLLHLPFAPTVHPMLEGVFNLLLSWAAMFAGFLSDDRKDKPNLFPMLPAVVGMQFLTSAFLLPYLALRSTETRSDVSGDDLNKAASVCESKLLSPFLGFVGTGSIFWAFLARPEFGDLQERWASFLELLSIDRVGSSFIVDLAIFALFQCWFIDDDMKRRGADDKTLALVGKYVPFFGMAAYLALRPKLKSVS